MQPVPIHHYENFPVASVLCPKALRAQIAALYHFARTADDLADEGDASADQRLADLKSYRTNLESAATWAQSPLAALDKPVFDARWQAVFAQLAQTIQTHALPLPPLHDLLDAFVQDVEMTRNGSLYPDEAALLDYCRRSANPVGRLLLHLYGVTQPAAMEQSDAICTALQLINFWQDPSRDLPRKRCYFTQEAMDLYGVALDDVWQQRQTPLATKMIAACAGTARNYLFFGAPLVHQIPGRAGWELRLVVQGGLRILDKIEALGFATLQQRPVLHWWDAPVILWRALWM